MKVSYNWLRDYVETQMTAHEAADALTMAGLAVELVEPTGDGDFRFTAEVTTNRPDWLGIVGIARELAAAAGGKLQLPAAEPLLEGARAAEEIVSVEVRDPDLCPRYTARAITGVKIAPSPPWLARRLEICGIRSINNVVDVTNYVMLERNQPLHAFDYDRLAGGRIVVRRAVEGEKLTTLDGVERRLTGENLLICDGAGPVALAGVMGAERSSVSAGTKNVLLESAYFQPLGVRRTSRALAIGTDSSYRFERGVDPEGAEAASRRAAGMILEFAGGELARGFIDTSPVAIPPREIQLRYWWVGNVLGMQIEKRAIRRILMDLGFSLSVERGDGVLVAVPGFRQDVAREIDLVEEIARIYGYDKIPNDLDLKAVVPRVSEVAAATRRGIGVMTALGFDQAMTDSFIEPQLAGMVELWRSGRPIVISNPMRSEQGQLRTSLIPSLLKVCAANRLRGAEAGRLVEINRAYLKHEEGRLPEEKLLLALVTEDGVLAAKGAVEALAEKLNVAPDMAFVPASFPFFAPGTSAELRVGGRMIGALGAASAQLTERFGMARGVAMAELDLNAMVACAGPAKMFRALPRFPSISRDLSPIVPEGVAWSELVGALESAGLDHVEKIEFVGVWRGEQTGDGKKSLSLRLVMRDPERTLTDAEANASQEAALKLLEEKFGAVFRR